MRGKTGEKERYSNFELLRIVSMIMIIAYHYSIKGQGRYISEMPFVNKVFIEEISMFGKIGVNLFILITGYFGVYSSGIKIIKMLKLECQVLFFSLFMMVFGGIAKGFILSGVRFQYIFPTIFNLYWFMTAYMILYCFMPFINKMLLALQDSEIKILRGLIIFIWCIIPTITFQLDAGMNWSQQIWMFTTYILGASFRLLPIKKRRRWWIIEVVLSVSFLMLSVLIIELVGREMPEISKYATYFRWSNSVLAVLVSIGFFVNFEKLGGGIVKTLIDWPQE